MAQLLATAGMAAREKELRAGELRAKLEHSLRTRGVLALEARAVKVTLVIDPALLRGIEVPVGKPHIRFTVSAGGRTIQRQDLAPRHRHDRRARRRRRRLHRAREPRHRQPARGGRHHRPGQGAGASGLMSKRPRGFDQTWRPTAPRLALLDNVERILVDYADQLPLTLRQVFYILVGRYGYEKTEKAYNRLGELINRARRAQLIAMEALRDDGFTEDAAPFYVDEQHFLDIVIQDAQTLRLDRQKGQARRLALWCEASGMAPQLRRIVDHWGIAVYSSGGFDSTKDRHRMAERWALEGDAVTVLHIGDHDPSGVHRFASLKEDVEAFATSYAGDVEFVRLAVTPEQAAHYRLVSSPPKATDRRRFEGDDTYQAEALDPRDLADIIRDAVLSDWDEPAYQRVLAAEREARQAVISRLSG
jgi:hypothetical protein